MDQKPRLGKRVLDCLLLYACNYVVSVLRGFLFLWVLGMGYVMSLLYSLSLPYNYFVDNEFLAILVMGDSTLLYVLLGFINKDILKEGILVFHLVIEILYCSQ